MSDATNTSVSEPAGLGGLPVAAPVRSAWLEFDAAVVGDSALLDKLRRNLSTLEIDAEGGHAWIGSDEHCFIERLTRGPGGEVFAGHRRYSLARPFALSSKDAEVDLEGLSRDGNRLWVLGSHCLTRKGAGEDIATAPAALDALERMQLRKRSKTRDRCVLGCLDIDRLPPDGDKVPARAAAMLPFSDGGSALIELLEEDEQLAPFLQIPAKENGLDLEGLAVRGEMALIGLRGPVLGGLAIVLELRLRVDAEGGEISLRKLDSGRRYAKHALDLQGLGIRALAFNGDRIAVLAAPTMPLDGIAAVFDWRVGERWPAGGIVPHSACRPLLRLPGGDRGDYAEGIACLGNEIAVVCDRPAEARLRGTTGIRIDFFRLPDAGAGSVTG